MIGARALRGKVWLGCAIVIGILALARAPALAANQDITITPTAVNTVVQPGSVNKGTFQVIDQGASSYTFTVYAAPYSVNGEDYTPDFTILPGAPTVASWFQFSINQATIQPGQAITINYTMSVPPDTPPGGYYAVAFAETHYPKANAGVTLNERVGEIFYLQVAGPVTQKAQLLTWQTSSFQEPPLTSVLRLQDSGSLHYESNITFKVSDIFGNTKFTLNTQKIILPQTIRRIPLVWTKAPSIGLFKVSGTAKFLGQTKTLPTKYVLVMSKSIRVDIIIIFVILVLIMILRAILRTLRRAKHHVKRRIARRRARPADNNGQE